MSPTTAAQESNGVEAASVVASPAEPVPQQVPPPDVTPGRYLRGLLAATAALLLVVLAVYLLQRFAIILQPLFIACFLLYLLVPIHRWFQRQGLPRSMAALMLLGTLLTLLIGAGYLVYGALYSLSSQQLGVYETRLDTLGAHLLTRLGFEEAAGHFQIRKLLFSEEGLNLPLREALMSASGTFFAFLTGTLVVLLYMVFIWLEWAHLANRLEVALGAERGREVAALVDRINHSISRYLGVLTLLCLMQGCVAMLVLGLLGVDLFLLWGILIFLLCYVPYLGPFVAIGTPILVTFVQYPDEPWRGLVALVVLVSVNQVTDNVINPRVTGHRLGISPLMVLLALSFWGALWGVVGMILAVPLTVTVKLILESIDATRPLAVLMSDR